LTSPGDGDRRSTSSPAPSANFPTRISFQVTSIDSRTILASRAPSSSRQATCLHGGGGRISRSLPFCTDEEVEKVVRHPSRTPQYLKPSPPPRRRGEDGNPALDATGCQPEGGDLYQQAVQVVLRDRKASTSYIQRRLQIGYNRAASLMERMEKEGVVGQANHAGKREILMGEEDAERY
jgi:S-DNA-T family DNA segregation ATPase FtsK/SpoIIIE